MHNYTFEDRNGRTWERIDARKARRLFCEGVTIAACPCNMRPFGPWECAIVLDSPEPPAHCIDEPTPAETFAKWADHVAFYNCDAERGRYLAWYTCGEVFAA